MRERGLFIGTSAVTLAHSACIMIQSQKHDQGPMVASGWLGDWLRASGKVCVREAREGGSQTKA